MLPQFHHTYIYIHTYTLIYVRYFAQAYKSGTISTLPGTYIPVPVLQGMMKTNMWPETIT